MARQVPIVEYLCLDEPPHLRASECGRCGAMYFDRRNACASCTSTAFVSRPLGTEGTVSCFSIVHRSAPGVSVPFVSAVVDLAGGGSVKSTLLNVDPTPEQVRVGMSVRMTTYIAGVDDEGTEAIAFGFEPVADGQRGRA